MERFVCSRTHRDRCRCERPCGVASPPLGCCGRAREVGMRYGARTLGVIGLLVACSGGSDQEDTSASAMAQERSAATEAAATANAVRDTIEAFRRRSGGSSSGPPTPPPSTARDPGPRETSSDAGDPLAGLTAAQAYAFNVGKEEFEEAEEAADGLGPTFNLNSCGGCHAQPAVGGTSPRINPQVAMANSANALPPFITA